MPVSTTSVWLWRSVLGTEHTTPARGPDRAGGPRRYFITEASYATPTGDGRDRVRLVIMTYADGDDREMAKWAHHRFNTARRRAEDAQRHALSEDASACS